MLSNSHANSYIFWDLCYISPIFLWLLYSILLLSDKNNSFLHSPLLWRDCLRSDISSYATTKQAVTMNRIRSPAFQFDLIDPLMAVKKNTSCFNSRSFPWRVLSIVSLLIYGIIIFKKYSKRSRTHKCHYPNVNYNLSTFKLFRFLINLSGNPLMLLRIHLIEQTDINNFVIILGSYF